MLVLLCPLHLWGVESHKSAVASRRVRQLQNNGKRVIGALERSVYSQSEEQKRSAYRRQKNSARNNATL